jgi:hypothetical protein
MFDIQPNREPDHQPRQPSQYRAPLSEPPAKPRSWWGTIPGQLALVAMLVGAIVIALGLAGVVGPLSQR